MINTYMDRTISSLAAEREIVFVFKSGNNLRLRMYEKRVFAIREGFPYRQADAECGLTLQVD